MLSLTFKLTYARAGFEAAHRRGTTNSSPLIQYILTLPQFANSPSLDICASTLPRAAFREVPQWLRESHAPAIPSEVFLQCWATGRRPAETLLLQDPNPGFAVLLQLLITQPVQGQVSRYPEQPCGELCRRFIRSPRFVDP